MHLRPTFRSSFGPRSAKKAITGLFVVALACGTQADPAAPLEVTVTGLDYAFQFPETLHAGQNVLRFRNAGKVPHEMGVALLKPGVSLAQVLELVKAGGSPDSLLDGTVGILIAEPGVTTLGALAVDLMPGRTYALFCNFRDGPDKPPHLALGMVSSRTIATTR